jgi:hypothetical protein
MLGNLGVVLGVVTLVWLGVLTYFFLKFSSSYQKLVTNNTKESLIDILRDILNQEKSLKKDIDQLYGRCDTLEKDGLSYVQKIGLSRFNPFKDTGGDQSFILTLLNADNTGVVISSLHSRTGTRWYAKKVVKGKGIEYALSSDEEKAVRESKVIEK